MHVVFLAVNLTAILFSPLKGDHQLVYLESHLSKTTAALADGCQAACCFVSDALAAEVLDASASWGAPGGTALCWI